MYIRKHLSSQFFGTMDPNKWSNKQKEIMSHENILTDLLKCYESIAFIVQLLH